jgi:hypothetical protein
MTQRRCGACEFFRPARTCMEKPTWGHCMKLVKIKPDWSVGKLRPLFTWADNHCDDYRTPQASSVHGSQGGVER